MKFIDIAKQRFGKLIVIKRIDNSKWGDTRWLCECDCGNLTKVNAGHLKSGKTKSCGCLTGEKARENNMKHGHCTRINGATKTYLVWQGMFARCNNPKDKGYKNYGGRGITVCQNWDNYENFLSDMGEVPNGLTIDRKDNDGNYEPGNCRWATYTEQARNRRRGKTLKLNLLKANIIRYLLEKSNLKQWEIGKIFGVEQTTISAIKYNNIWR